ASCRSGWPAKKQEVLIVCQVAPSGEGKVPWIVRPAVSRGTLIPPYHFVSVLCPKKFQVPPCAEYLSSSTSTRRRFPDALCRWCMNRITGPSCVEAALIALC